MKTLFTVGHVLMTVIVVGLLLSQGADLLSTLVATAVSLIASGVLAMFAHPSPLGDGESATTKAKLYDLCIVTMNLFIFTLLVTGQPQLVYLFALPTSLVLALYGRVKVPKKPSSTEAVLLGIVYGVTMFFIAMVGVFVASSFLDIDMNPLLASLSLYTFEPVYFLYLVSVPEEMLSRFLYITAGSAISGLTTTTFWCNFVFTMLHAPTRLLAGESGLVAMVIIAVVSSTITYGYTKTGNPLFSITAHTVYNVLLSLFMAGNIIDVICAILALAVLLYTLSRGERK